ncbi:MAG: sulfatase-like hydrolase/transferase [Polyangiaceae bacterium]|nr:sulfatase-like hydrolase/transferase [Polyangiaceae bacterium]
MSATLGVGRAEWESSVASTGALRGVRILGGAGGAALASALVALLDARRAVNLRAVPFGAAWAGDLAAMAPIALGVGVGVSAAALALDPAGRWSLARLIRPFLSLRGEARARAAALALVTPALVFVWVILAAQAGRSAFSAGLPMASGVEVAVVCLAGVLFAAAAALAAVPLLARYVTGAVTPTVAAVCGAIYAAAAFALGVYLGDVSGNGPTPLAILGVITRPELDLSPVLGVVSFAVGAAIGERVASVTRHSWIAGAALSVGALVGLVVFEATALSEAPDVASAIESSAAMGRIGFALERAATDFDRDGASALFGGGDCDDADPRRSPTAIDIPGNGIDEDCSGEDLPAPRASAAAPSAPPPPRRLVRDDLNLVLITIDTLRIDLGFMGYPRPVSPNLDALAARSTVFERAYSMASYTGKSVGPTMIGKYPSETLRDGAHFDTYFPENVLLAERLRAAGFRTMGVASHWYFQPKYGLTQGMDLWDMTAMPRETSHDVDSSVTSDRLTDAAIRLLSDPTNVDRRFFFWGHYFDPHANYVAHAGAPDFHSGARGWAKPAYDGEVWFTDHHLGRLFDFVAAQPWAERTAIVVTADHGEAFEEHGMNWHGVDLWEPLVRVPLIVYVPGTKAHRVAPKRSLVDLVPTILDLLGIDAPQGGELSGTSTAAAIVSPEAPGALDERDVFIDMPAGPQVSQHRAIIHGDTPGMKLLSEGAAWYFLFDLSRDPGELNDLARDKAKFSDLREVFDAKLSTLHTIHVAPAPYQAR